MQPLVPPRPSIQEERLSMRLFLALSPRLERGPRQPEPPGDLLPFEDVAVPRETGGALAATWYPAEGGGRGAVLLVHPWLPWGRAYFHRRGRIEALRAAGYHALTLDLGGFGESPRAPGFFDRDVEAGLRFLRERAAGRPLHLWGVSAGGYWSHFVLSRTNGVAGAVFEDVSPHLFEWSWRMAPLGRPAYLFFRGVFRSSYRYLDARLHAPALTPAAVAYVSGGRDRGVRPEDTETLARLSGARCLIVPGAEHLASIKLANEEILALALETFRKAEARPTPAPGSSPAPSA
ncbi:MAG: alpha/beta hydrolase [Thermoanaerobaculia bacterium]